MYTNTKKHGLFLLRKVQIELDPIYTKWTHNKTV